MSDPQGLFHWPGVNAVIDGSFTLGHGLMPSMAILKISPQSASSIAPHGTLTLTYGRTTLSFPGCRVSLADLQGGTTEILRIEDRRWRWRFGGVSGQYNIVGKDGQIITDTDKTPQELAQLLLESMGERNTSVSEMPNFARPEVRWDFAVPAVELNSLATDNGSRIVLDTKNRVSIRRGGKGRKPSLRGVIQPAEGMQVDARPDSIFVKGGPVSFQSRLKLEAVEELEDGTYEAVSPSETFSSLNFTSVEDEEERTRKARSIFRVFRAASQADGTDTVPGTQNGEGFLDAKELAKLSTKEKKAAQLPPIPISGLLPLKNELHDTLKGDDDIFRPAPGRVIGEFWDGSMTFENINGEWPETFSLDSERGLVTFSQPVAKLVDDPDDPAGYLYELPDLYLECTYNVRKDRNQLRFGVSRDLGGRQGTGPRVLHREEIIRQVTTRYSGDDPPDEQSTVEDNYAEVLKEANYSIEAAKLEYQDTRSARYKFAGFLDISPDGLIQQVRWSFGRDGAFTELSLGTEFDLKVPSYEKRNQIATLFATQQEQAAAAKAAKKQGDNGAQ